MEKLEIWGKVIPGNRSARKDMVMEIQKKKNPDHTVDMIKWILSIRGKEYTEEDMVSVTDIKEYMEKLKESETEEKEVLVRGAHHRFGAALG